MTAVFGVKVAGATTVTSAEPVMSPPSARTRIIAGPTFPLPAGENVAVTLPSASVNGACEMGRVPGAVELRVKRGGSLPADNGRCVTARGFAGEAAAEAEKNREEGRDENPGHGGAAAAAAGTGSRSLESVAA